MCNRLDRLNVIQIKLALEKLAYWHAASMMYYEINGPYPNFFKYGLYNENLKDDFKDYFNQITNAFITKVNELSIKDEYKEKIQKWKDNLYSRCCELAQENSNKINVLNHGDMWNNNVMFLFENDEKVIKLKFVSIIISGSYL